MNSRNASPLADEYRMTGRSPVPVIDVHTHMNGIAGVSMPAGGHIADCLARMDEIGVREIWCSAHDDLFSPSPAGNTVTERLMHEYPGRVKGYFCFNPNHKEVYERKLPAVLEIPGYIGIKVLPNYHNNALDGAAYEGVLSFADRHRLLVLSHTWGDKPQNSCKEVAAVLKKYRNLRFIIGHSAPGDLDTAIALAKQHDNAFLDLCDIHRHSGIVAKMVNAVGSERVLFGTDMPWYDPTYCLGSVLFAHIMDTDRENILYRNAKRILKEIGR